MTVSNRAVPTTMARTAHGTAAIKFLIAIKPNQHNQHQGDRRTPALQMIRLTPSSQGINTMKTRSILSTVALVLTGIALTFGTASAQRGGHGRGQGAAKMEGKMKELNLTDAQKAQIKQLRDAFQQQNSSQMAQLKSLREQMKTARQAQNKEQAKALMGQMKTAMEAMKPAREKLHQDILAILTPEQRAKMEQMKSEGKGHRGRGGRGSAQGGTANSGSTTSGSASGEAAGGAAQRGIK